MAKIRVKIYTSKFRIRKTRILKITPKENKKLRKKSELSHTIHVNF